MIIFLTHVIGNHLDISILDNLLLLQIHLINVNTKTESILFQKIGEHAPITS